MSARAWRGQGYSVTREIRLPRLRVTGPSEETRISIGSGPIKSGILSKAPKTQNSPLSEYLQVPSLQRPDFRFRASIAQATMPSYVQMSRWGKASRVSCYRALQNGPCGRACLMCEATLLPRPTVLSPSSVGCFNGFNLRGNARWVSLSLWGALCEPKCRCIAS